MSWAKAIGASVQTGIAAGAWATDKYNEKRDIKNRPKYIVPTEVQQNLSQAEQQALQGLPEAQKQEYISNLQRSQAYSLNQLGDRKAGLTGVAALNQNANDSYGNLLSMDSQARERNQGVLMGQRQNMADYKDQAFQFNVVDPYYEHIARRDARNGAVQKSSMNAAQSFGGGGGMGQGMGGGKSKMYTPSSSNQTGMQNYNNNSIQNNPNNGNYGYQGDVGQSFGTYGGSTYTG